MNSKALLGEFIGTFILVFIGCGSVAVAVLYNSINLYQIASIWGIGVAFAIYATRKYSPAHLNPAVTFGMLLLKKQSFTTSLYYIGSQLLGASIAGIFLYLIFNPVIQSFEAEHEIIRGTLASQKTSMIFGEFYPNPGNNTLQNLSTLSAFFLESIGTFLLMIGILVITNSSRISSKAIPILIGATVTLLIIFIAPYTQAGLNPARDFGPRLVAYFSGWGNASFPIQSFGFLIVYILGPISGAILASIIFKFFRPILIK